MTEQEKMAQDAPTPTLQLTVKLGPDITRADSLSLVPRHMALTEGRLELHEKESRRLGARNEQMTFTLQLEADESGRLLGVEDDQVELRSNLETRNKSDGIVPRSLASTGPLFQLAETLQRSDASSPQDVTIVIGLNGYMVEGRQRSWPSGQTPINFIL